jgi:CheY-like chemotaxis protein
VNEVLSQCLNEAVLYRKNGGRKIAQTTVSVNACLCYLFGKEKYSNLKQQEYTHCRLSSYIRDTGSGTHVRYKHNNKAGSTCSTIVEKVYRRKTLIRILVVDDHDLVRTGIARMLNDEQGVEVVGEARNGEDAIIEARKLRPDVVLMDVRMPDMNGIAATHKIHARFPDVQVIILTTFDNDEYVYESLESGAAGYLLKNEIGRAHV